MTRNTRFWLNVSLIGLAHLALITGLVRWSREPKKTPAQSVVWMGGDSGGAPVAATPTPEPRTEKASLPTPEPKQQEDTEEDQPILTAAKSEIQLPVPTPKPTPTPPATPRTTPKPTPEVKVTPPKHKPRPKPSPKPTPTPSPRKTVLAKASHKPPKKATPKKDEEDVDLKKKKVAQKKPEIKAEAPSPEKTSKTIATHVAREKGTGSGGGGHSGGASIQSHFGWYGNMLHDRFYSEWVQPTSLDSSSKMSALVRIRIEKDGRISDFEIVRPSGNAEVDASINAVAKRVTKVDPLPAGLGGGDHYDVKINFELHSE